MLFLNLSIANANRENYMRMAIVINKSRTATFNIVSACRKTMDCFLAWPNQRDLNYGRFYLTVTHQIIIYRL